MFEFAQTNLQLFKQMDEEGYSLADRAMVAGAYRQIMPMFSGRYRGNEKPFISHLVGTASILVSGRMDVDLVLAGLLHAVYMAGDFGFQPGTRQTQRKRQVTREWAGDAAETIIAAYDDSRWDPESVKSWLSMHDPLTELERSVIILHLANTLEDFLDHGVGYCRGSKLARLSRPEMQRDILTLAHCHAWPVLATNLNNAFSDFNSGKTPVVRAGFIGESALILPPSARRRLLPIGLGWLVRRLRRFKTTTRQGQYLHER